MERISTKPAEPIKQGRLYLNVRFWPIADIPQSRGRHGDANVRSRPEADIQKALSRSARPWIDLMFVLSEQLDVACDPGEPFRRYAEYLEINRSRFPVSAY